MGETKSEMNSKVDGTEVERMSVAIIWSKWNVDVIVMSRRIDNSTENRLSAV